MITLLLVLAVVAPQAVVAPPAAVAPVPAASTSTVEDPQAWFAERGATVEYFDGLDCRDLEVGPSHVEALLCTHYRDGGGERAPGPWVNTRRVAYVVRAGKIATVLDVGVSYQGLDSGWPRLILQIEFSADGKSVALVDRNIVHPPQPGRPNEVEPNEGCKSAAASSVFLRRLCKERGTYRWNGKRYVRGR